MSITEQLLVCFRCHLLDIRAEAYLEDASQLSEVVLRVGGTMVAWGADRQCYAFDPGQFSAVLDASVGWVRAAPRWSAGVACGELASGEVGRMGTFCWGRSSVVANALAAATQSGEILLDPSLPGVESGELPTLGSIAVECPAGQLRAALMLPASRASHAQKGLAPLRRTPTSETPVPPEASAVSSSDFPPAGPSIGRPLSHPPLKPRSVSPSATGTEGEHSSSPAARVRAHVRTVEVRRPQNLPAVPRGSKALAHQQETAPHQSVVGALRDGRVDSWFGLATDIRTDPGRGSLADRLEALAGLARGERSLENLAAAAAAAADGGGSEAARAGLAYALGLALEERVEEALLEGLQALAYARDASDERGERACASLLVQLARAEGRSNVAAAWARVAAGAENVGG